MPPTNEDLDTSDNGGLRHDEGKLQWDLLPGSFVRAVVEVLNDGAEKYAPWNWARGMHWTRVANCQRRHWEWFWLEGERFDKESGRHHLAHMATNIMFLYIYDMFGLGVDDRHRVQGGFPEPAPGPESDVTYRATVLTGPHRPGPTQEASHVD